MNRSEAYALVLAEVRDRLRVIIRALQILEAMQQWRKERQEYGNAESRF